MRTKLRQGERQFLRLRFPRPARRRRRVNLAVHRRFVNGARRRRPALPPVISVINQQLSRKYAAFFPRSGTGRAKITLLKVRSQIYVTGMTWLFPSLLMGEGQAAGEITSRLLCLIPPPPDSLPPGEGEFIGLDL